VAHQILDLLGCSYAIPQSGLFVWAKVPDTIADVEKWVDEILYQTKVFITPGFVFGESGKRYIRISLCSPEEKLSEARDRIGNWVKSKSLKEQSSKTVTA
jgi:aspartate/methionine/tyrosine aminotransferase